MIHDLIINNNITIIEAVKILDKTACRVLFVVNDKDMLVGCITDGDIRRGILKNIDFDDNVTSIMNCKPIFVYQDEINLHESKIKQNTLFGVPIVDRNLHIVDILLNEEMRKKHTKHTMYKNLPVVLMAGGMGTRLKPITNIIPKPLIPIGDSTIIEKIMDNFSSFGDCQFYMVINYMKNMIKAYFNDSDKDYNLHYVEEEKPLGTFGGLYKLKGTIQDTFFLSNCDILIEANYADIYEYHKKMGNKITIVTSLLYNQVPYGVIELNKQGTVEKILEKPEHKMLVNTGMYIIEPDMIDQIPDNTFYHLTDHINVCLNNGAKIGTYPIRLGSWIDIGEFKDVSTMFNTIGYIGDSK